MTAFPSLQDQIGENSFYVFGGFCLLATVFVFFMVPETKGKTVEEIQEEFK